MKVDGVEGKGKVVNGHGDPVGIMTMISAFWFLFLVLSCSDCVYCVTSHFCLWSFPSTIIVCLTLIGFTWSLLPCPSSWVCVFICQLIVWVSVDWVLCCLCSCLFHLYFTFLHFYHLKFEWAKRCEEKDQRPGAKNWIRLTGQLLPTWGWCSHNNSQQSSTFSKCMTLLRKYVQKRISAQLNLWH